MKRSKLVMIIAVALLCVFLCAASVFADNDGWDTYSDLNHLGEGGSIYIYANGTYYCKDFNTGIEFSSGGLQSVLDTVPSKLESLSGEKDLYIIFRPYSEVRPYYLTYNMSIPDSITSLGTLEIRVNGQDVYLKGGSAIYCQNLNLFSEPGSGGSLPPYDEFDVPSRGALRRCCDISFHAKNFDIHDLDFFQNLSTSIQYLELTNPSGSYVMENVLTYGPYNGSGNDGLYFYIPTSDVSLELNDCYFWNASTAADYSPVIKIEGTGVKIKGNGNTVFDRCTGYYGGAISVLNTGARISGLNFKGCHAEYGGAIYVDDYINDCEITNCKFEGNTSDNDGGAIYTNGEHITIEECIFLENESGDCGGAIHSNDYYNHVRRCTFYGNECDDCGGAIYMGYSYENSVEESAFSNNFAFKYAENGHSLYLANGVTLLGCRFDNPQYNEISGTINDGGGNEFDINRSFEDWGYFWQNNDAGSILSGGNVAILISVAAVAVLVVTVIAIKKKKTN